MYIPLEDFFNKMKNAPDEKQELVKINFNSFNKDIFRTDLPNIMNMNEHDLAIFIKNNIDTISDDILNNQIDYAYLFTDDKFSSSFIKAINSIPITYTIQLACNKVAYDYFTSGSNEIELKKKYLNMSKIVNKDAINKLISIGLDENTATNLAFCRYSSSNERINADRLNFSIYFRDPEIMTEQTIVYIYEKLFSRISNLFQATMFDVYTQQQFEDFGENFLEVYGTVGISVLLILNNMTTENIRKVLISYSNDWEYKKRPPVRFSLYALSNDYSRISRVVDIIKLEGYMVP